MQPSFPTHDGDDQESGRGGGGRSSGHGGSIPMSDWGSIAPPPRASAPSIAYGGGGGGGGVAPGGSAGGNGTLGALSMMGMTASAASGSGGGSGGGAGGPSMGSMAAAGMSMLQDPSQRQMLGDIAGKFIPKTPGWVSIDPLKYYFHVNNAYVLSKLKILLFPFAHKQWQREVVDSGDGGLRGEGQTVVYKPPCYDINAPDLYIPTMAIITFILLFGYASGQAGRFTPELLGSTAGKTIIVLALEICLIKAGFYLFCPQVSAPSIGDLVAYSSYKYVGLIVDLVVGLLLPSYCFYLAVAVFGFFSCVFIMRALQRSVIPVVETGLAGEGQNRRRSFLLALGFLQLLVCFALLKGAIHTPAVDPRAAVTS